jgi:YebC/PmpR family DNA-binding regulatory protein
MAGHSKWANIKHRKGAQDAKRGKVFTKIIKEIVVAVKEGGADSDTNPRLRVAVQNAKNVNMPKDNVQRAINKAVGGDGDDLREVTYEGYLPHGVAVFIECMTDNINRTVAEIRAVFNKMGGELGKNGALEFLFKRKGFFFVEKKQFNETLEEIEMQLIDYGLEELEVEDEVCTIMCDFDTFGTLQKKLEDMEVEITATEIERVPNDLVKLKNDVTLGILKSIERFEELEDVQKVFHNLKVSESVIQILNEES